MGSISCMIAIKVLVSQRFMHQQGLAIGAALLGTSVAGIFTPPLATWLIGIYGWRMTVALLSIGIWTVALPVFLRIVKEPQDAEIEGAGPADSSSQTKREESAAAAIDFSDVLRSRSFWMIGLAVSLIGFVDQSMGQHLMLYLIEDVKFSREDAAWVLSAVFGVSIAGKLGFGWLYDKLSVKGVMLCYFLMSVAVLLMFPISILSALVAFIITRGLAHGGSIVDIPVLSKHCFGPKVLGKTIGILTACVTIGFAIGPPLVGYMYDTQGSYRNAFIMLAVASIAAGLSLLGVKTTYRDRIIALEQSRVQGSETSA
jgi:predicted MFS family arabinose efflux permease